MPHTDKAPEASLVRQVSEATWHRHVALCRLFVQQDLEARFAGSLLGMMWTVVAPLLQLAVFYLVFQHVFKARVPGLDAEGYLAFLALGFWPWFAFSDAVVRAVTAIQDHAALSSKVAFPRLLLPVARVLAAFSIHAGGFVLVLLVLAVAGPVMHWDHLPFALLLWVPMLVMAIGLGLIFSALQVFIRDLAQSIGPALSLWFFLTPIVYAMAMTPPAFAAALQWNPLTAVVQSQRNLLLFGDAMIPGWQALIVGTILFPLLGLWLFRRLEPWFEDYL